jgi:hypothetical protein
MTRVNAFVKAVLFVATGGDIVTGQIHITSQRHKAVSRLRGSHVPNRQGCKLIEGDGQTG